MKRTMESVVASALRSRLQSRRLSGRVAVLAFHNVIPDTTEANDVDASLHLTYSSFLAILDTIAALPNTHVVPITDALVASGGELRVALTFDDAYRGAIRLGVPALVERSMPATVFVAPGLFGTVPWWDVMRNTVEPAAWERRREEWLSAPSCGLAAHILRDTGVPDLSPDFGIAELEELSRACGTGFLRVGCHTWNHPCLPSLTDEICRTELQRNRDWLAASGLPYDLVHAFPYGRWSERDARMLRELGYHRAFMITGGPVDALETFCLPRINVPAGLSPNGLLARIAGVRRDG